MGMNSDAKFCSYRMRCGEQEFESEKEKLLMEILMEFGKSIDSQGCDGGDYDKAMIGIFRIINDDQHTAKEGI